MKIGAFIPTSNGFANAVHQAALYGCNCMMIYTGSPKSYNRGTINESSVRAGLTAMELQGVKELIIHAPYIANPASPDKERHERAIRVLEDELERTKQYHSNLLVIHPGSHMGAGTEAGVAQLADLLNHICNPSLPTVCVETMAGKGNEIGRKLEDFRLLLERVNNPDLIGFCLDTCHMFDAGYDFENNLEGIMKNIESTIGLSKVKVIHVNGSLYGLGSHKDRHANLLSPDNELKIEVLRRFCQQDCFKNIPMVLETPYDNYYDDYLYKTEIEALKQK